VLAVDAGGRTKMATYSYVSGNVRGSVEMDPTATPVPEGVDPADAHAAAVEDAIAKAKADVARDVIREVSLRRPDLAAHDEIAVVLQNDPTLDADGVIAVLDEARAEHQAEKE
jgi:uncharacterized protein CbrC (UPF0167 family)